MNVTRRNFLQSIFIFSTMTAKKGWANPMQKPVTERRDLFPQGVASGWKFHVLEPHSPREFTAKLPWRRGVKAAGISSLHEHQCDLK